MFSSLWWSLLASFCTSNNPGDDLDRCSYGEYSFLYSWFQSMGLNHFHVWFLKSFVQVSKSKPLNWRDRHSGVYLSEGSRLRNGTSMVQTQANWQLKGAEPVSLECKWDAFLALHSSPPDFMPTVLFPWCSQTHPSILFVIPSRLPVHLPPSLYIPQWEIMIESFQIDFLYVGPVCHSFQSRASCNVVRTAGLWECRWTRKCSIKGRKEILKTIPSSSPPEPSVDSEASSQGRNMARNQLWRQDKKREHNEIVYGRLTHFKCQN